MLTAELLTPVTHSHYEREAAGGPWDLSRCAGSTGYVGRLLTLTIAITLLGAAPAGGGGMTPSTPDLRLVLSVVNPGSRHQEMVVVGHARGGPVHSRRLPGGTLCHGPLLTVGERVVYLNSRSGGQQAVSLGLDLRGRPQPLARADWIGASATPGRLWAASARWSDRGWLYGPLRELDGRGHQMRLAPRPGLQQPRAPGAPTANGAGALSPDGYWLARPVARHRQRSIALVDRSTGQRRMLRGTRLGLYESLAWSPSGRWLIYADERERLRAHRVADGVDIELPLRPRGNVMSLSALPGGR